MNRRLSGGVNGFRQQTGHQQDQQNGQRKGGPKRHRGSAARRLPRLAACLMVCALAGCAPPEMSRDLPPLVSQPLSAPAPVNMLGVAYGAADAMAAAIDGRHPRQAPIVPVTFVDLDQMEQTSSLGRLLARQMGSRLTQNGFSVLEVRLRQDLLIRPETGDQTGGEFMLSRDLERLVQEQNAKAVLVGHYTVARNQIFVNAQLIRIRDRSALASQDFVLPLGANERRLLGMPL